MAAKKKKFAKVKIDQDKVFSFRNSQVAIEILKAIPHNPHWTLHDMLMCAADSGAGRLMLTLNEVLPKDEVMKIMELRNKYVCLRNAKGKGFVVVEVESKSQ